MKVLLCGSKGQLGIAIKKFCPDNFQLFDKSKEELDICNFNNLKNYINILKPDIIINAAAYTSVDKAEENQKIAKKINYEGPKNLSEISKRKKIKIIHISTDYVFDGESTLPYKENDITNPLSYYGKTKQMSEKAFINNNNYIIFRVSWLYGPYKENFVTKILKVGQEKQKIKVIADQFSVPTSTFDLAELIWIACNKLAQSSNFYGLYHYSGSGEAISWYEFTKSIFSNVQQFGYSAPIVQPILTHEFKSEALRPKYSCLNVNKTLQTFNFSNRNWEDSLKVVLNEIFKKNKYFL